jgi:membrane protease YdiL (CAAX protease family)
VRPESEFDRRAAALFFVLAFVPSWAGWTTLHRLAASPPTPSWWPLLFYSGTTIAVAGLAAAWAAGPGELRRLARESVRLRARPLAWALVLLTPIVWVGLSVLAYAATHGGTLGRVELGEWWRVMTRPDGLVNLAYPVTEEIAWRGFLLPHWMKRRGALSAALAVGAVWAVWHLPFYWSRLVQDPLWFATFALGVLCLGVIFAGVYLAGRSVLLCMLLHWHVNAIQDAVGPTFPDLPGLGRADAFGLTFTVVIVAIAAAFAVALRRHDARSGIRRAS